mgnify:CR=1 FL=1
MGSADRSAVLTVSSAAILANRDRGIGFWNELDARRQATAEDKRTGRPHRLTPERTPFGSHVLWFVTPAAQERGVA